jgi:nickel/cobalt exporter
VTGQLHGPDHNWDAEQIARQLTTNGSNVITGSRILCPASVTVLLFSLQLGQFMFGAATVAVFSLGLAITMVAIGVVGTWSVRPASKRINLSNRRLRHLPPASADLVGVLGIAMLMQGIVDLATPKMALS